MGVFNSFPARTVFFIILCCFWLPFLAKCFIDDNSHYLELYLNYVTITAAWRNRHGMTFLDGSLHPENILYYRCLIVRIWGYMVLCSLVLFKFGRFEWMRNLSKFVLAISALFLAL